jgi:hypothetical protein
LVVDDDEAVYPVVIDPLLTASADTQLESDQMNTNLGVSVAGAGDVNNDGYADVIVGAYRYDAGETDEGAAFIFLGSDSGIVANGNPANADAQIESNQAWAWLGWSVAGAGSVNDDDYADVIVGAYRFLFPSDEFDVEVGAAFIFHGSDSGIVANGNPANANTMLVADRAEAWLGHSVAGAGDVNGDGYADVIVGAPNYTEVSDDEVMTPGAAFIFLGSPTGIDDGFAGEADTKLEAPFNQGGSLFGFSVAGAGSVNDDVYADVIVGAPFYDAVPEDPKEFVNVGAAFIFLGSGTGIPDGSPDTAATQLIAAPDEVNMFFGYSVAGAGDVDNDGYTDVIVGAPRYDAGEPEEGAAFVFLGSPTGIDDGGPSTAASRLESDQDGAKMGQSVAGIGDINGDDFADVIVGAYRYDAGETEEGAAFVFLGSDSGIVANGNPANADVQLESDQPWAWLGWSVAGAGDVNGDGAPDTIVGAPDYDAGQVREGAAFVFLSEPTLVILPEPAFIVGLAAGVACLAIFARLRRRGDRAM